MNQTIQHISPSPALDFANGILEETNGALELIEILRDIADGADEKATTNDRIAANTVLLDRGLGKCPKQPPAPGPNPNPAPPTDDTDVRALRESPPAIPHDEPESPRLVTQIDNSLHDSLGPAPSAHTPNRHSREGGNPESYDTSDSPEQNIPESPAPFNPYSIHLTIQQHILAITNNGQTLRRNLLEIARAKDDPKACPEQEPALKACPEQSRRGPKDHNLPPPKGHHHPHRPPLGHRPQRAPKRGLPRMPPKVDDPLRFTRSPCIRSKGFAWT